MDAIAANQNAASRIPAPVRTFLSVRRAQAAVSGVIVLAGLTAWLGSYETTLPAMVSQGRAVIPLWRMLAMGAAVAPIVSMYSQLTSLEAVATNRLRRYQRGYLAGMGFGGASIYLGIAATTLPPAVLAIIARSWLAWSGLALISGVLLGWRLAWTLPVGVSVILWFWGSVGPDLYAWWEFSARPHDDLPSLLLSVGLLLSGIGAYWATPWRRRWRTSEGTRQ